MTDMERLENVRAKFEALSLQLQRAVGEAKVEVGHGGERWGEAGVWLPRELWEEVVRAYDAIGAYAREVAFEEGARMAAEAQRRKEMLVVRVRQGAFVGSPPGYTMQDKYVEAEVCRRAADGAVEISGDRCYLRHLPEGSPLYVPLAYVHPEDLEKIPGLPARRR